MNSSKIVRPLRGIRPCGCWSTFVLSSTISASPHESSLDDCVPGIVKRGLPDRDIVTVQEMGWAGIKNGRLLRLVSPEFNVVITSDKNLRHQQNLSALDLAIILLPSNQVPVVRSLIPAIDIAIDEMDRQGLIEL